MWNFVRPNELIQCGNLKGILKEVRHLLEVGETSLLNETTGFCGSLVGAAIATHAEWNKRQREKCF
jgi:hypothetical protein